MTHASLFSGIGGFDLAAEWMGWENIFHCEWNPFGQKVLKHHFPNSKSYEDITKTDFSIHRGTIDILTGGFPCQPYSSAGKRLGKEDERHLWPHMLRTIEEVQPRFVVGENVRGLTNWNGGLVFDEVQFDLETKGYEVIPFLLLACAVNAPHRRDRIWFIAHCDNKIGQREECNNSGWEDKKPKSHNRNDLRNNIGATNERELITNSDKIRLSTKMENGKLERGFRPTKRDERDMWHSFPTQSPICGGNDGIPRELDSITFPKWRNESIKAYGNAIVPQVAYQIFKAIQQYDTNHSQTNC
jgi:DNA (cytosine-5)-methyltransferase 1